MTNKKEYKILRKTLSLTLAILVSILGIPLAEPQQASATETSGAKFLSKVTIDATADEETLWEKKYDEKLYTTLTGSDYDSSYKTEEDALKIGTAAELAAFAKAVNEGQRFDEKYVKLTANIDLNGEKPTVTKTDSTDSSKFDITVTNPVGEDGKAAAVKNVWTPIGTHTNNFLGTFDGGGFEVRNMTVLMSKTGEVVAAGLFGCLRGEIKNTVVRGNVYASFSSSPSFSSSMSVCAGGLAGWSRNGDIGISNSYATGDVYVFSPENVYVGALVGYSTGISNSYATGMFTFLVLGMLMSVGWLVRIMVI